MFLFTAIKLGELLIDNPKFMNLRQLDLLTEYVRTVHFIMVIGQLIFFLAKLNLIYLDLAVFTKLLPNHVQIKPRRF